MIDKIKAFFSLVIRKAKSVILSIINREFALFFNAFWNTAVEIVKKLEPVDLNSEDKRKKAYEFIANTVDSTWSDTVKDSWIYLLIEIAKQYIKRG